MLKTITQSVTNLKEFLPSNKFYWKLLQYFKTAPFILISF